MCCKNALFVADDEGDDGADAAGNVSIWSGPRAIDAARIEMNKNSYLGVVGEAAVDAVDAVATLCGLRRGSWRRFEMPASLVKEELDLPNLEPFEKLGCLELDLENILLARLLFPCH